MFQLTKLFNYTFNSKLSGREIRKNVACIIFLSTKSYSNERNEYNNIMPQVKVERLKTRSILSIEGSDSLDLLQELATNDIQVLGVSEKCLYTAFLNTKGKVIHDAIVYKPVTENQYLVECDVSSIEALQIHMAMCRGGKRVDIVSAENRVYVWVVYSPQEDDLEEVDFGDDMLVCRDPRISNLGLRIVAPASVDVGKKISEQGLTVIRSQPSSYKSLRYKLGVGEGSREIPYGRFSPLEVNCDYLNGLDLKKSTAFIGQDEMLSHGKGLFTESRFMPIFLDLTKNDNFPLNTPIEDIKSKKKNPVGYLRGSQGRVGIGLMQVAEALQEGSVRIGTVIAHCIKPPWWPIK